MTEMWDPAIADDPYTFVLFAFPWGKSGTPLAKFSGPRTWQCDELQAISAHIKTNKVLLAQNREPAIYQSATVSGRGTGKSALVSMLNYWMMSTQLGSTSVNTANTEDQLKSKTWAEVGKWHTLAINSHWFERQTLSLKPALWFQDALKRQLKIDSGYYYAQAQLWSEEKPDAFAGVHNDKGILVVFDEASGIPKPIWTVTEGFFTEPILHRYWLVFSNGRKNTGSFFECFHAHRAYWRRRHLDSRKVEGTDKTLLNNIVQKYGEDSDEARVEVKGEFPRQGDRQFISRSIVDDAVARTLEPENLDIWAPLIMGVDPARFGDDEAVIRWRQGRNARVLPPSTFKGLDNVQLADEVAGLINKYNPDAVNVDSGAGAGVIDTLRSRGYKVNEIGFGRASPEPQWLNFRTFMWAEMRDWLPGGIIDSNTNLVTDLTAPEYKFVNERQRLETKEELKARGFASPNHGDALCLTFAVKVPHNGIKASRNFTGRTNRVARDVDYEMF